MNIYISNTEIFDGLLVKTPCDFKNLIGVSNSYNKLELITYFDYNYRVYKSGKNSNQVTYLQ